MATTRTFGNYINVVNSIRETEKGFTEHTSSSFLGPTLMRGSVSAPAITLQKVAVWTVLNKFNDELKNHLISFIDTTMEGVSFASNPKGREKRITFNFSGNVTKSIIPGEIGEFSLVLGYYPGADSTTDTSTLISG